MPWGFEVSLPQEFDWDYGDRQARHDFAVLARIGVRRADGRPMGRGTGGIFLPTGINGPAFVVTDNFEVIRQYNTSDSYALAVGHLGDRIFGGGPIRKAWPTGERQLSNAEIAELQRLLQSRGPHGRPHRRPRGAGDPQAGPDRAEAAWARARWTPEPGFLARMRGG